MKLCENTEFSSMRTCFLIFRLFSVSVRSLTDIVFLIFSVIFLKIPTFFVMSVCVIPSEVRGLVSFLFFLFFVFYQSDRIRRSNDESFIIFLRLL